METMMEEIIQENGEIQETGEVINDKTPQESRRYYYAQLNAEGICCAVSDLSGQVGREDMIPLESYDLLVLGKKYQSGVWEETAKEETAPQPTVIAETQPTNAEIKTLLESVQAQNQALLEALAEMYEQKDL